MLQKGAVVAVTKFKTICPFKPFSKGEGTVRISPISLQTLTAAALTLPGLMQTPAYAADEETSFTYGHYQEGNRNLFGGQSAFSPIEVESLQGSTKFKLTDRVKFAFNYVQDTWGGATPIATAPLSAGGNKYIGNGQIVSGATPYLEAGNRLVLDKNLNVLQPKFNPDGSVAIDANGLRMFGGKDQFVHTLSQASPETRKQGDFKLGYEWDEAALDIGGGISIEDDYESRFGNINTRWDFNQKQTTLNVGLSYTNSDTHATLDHDAVPYIEISDTYDPVQIFPELDGKRTITGNRQDWSTSLSLTQILNKNALLEASAGFTRSTGYMANPYKAVSVVFIDPLQQDSSSCPETVIGLQCVDNIHALLEQRPEVRNQWMGNLRYVQHIDAVDASMHLGYRVFSDDWGITSHTFDADWAQPLGNGWTVTPRVRYYSQDAADFYTPLLVSEQAFQSNVVDPVKGAVLIDTNNPNSPDFFDDINGIFIPDGASVGQNPLTGNALLDANGNPVSQTEIDNLSLDNKKVGFDRSKLPQNFSSDHRLSGYGALSGGVTVSKQFAKGVGLDLGFEYYTHQGGLKIGGGGEGNYADFDYWTANATLKVDLAALSFGSNSGNHAMHDHHSHGVHAPAGVMFDHMLPKAGDMMVGYRYMYGNQSGDMLHGNQQVNNQAIVDGGCGPNPCFLTPNNMTMHMHMLDLMYAPTDWLTLMLMPQFVDMGMGMERLNGAPADQESNNNVGNPLDQNGQPINIAAHIPHHVQNGHETGGIGDLGMYALFKLLDTGIHHIHATAGLSAPTGDVDIQLRKNHTIDGGFIHYGMQLGSGTWDFKPSLTYTGHIDQFSWGAQANGTVRMESKNKSGYRLGDLFQATAWGSYDLTSWLTASVRGVYTLQGGIEGNFNGLINQFGPMDYPQNYGGKYWDVGFGLSAVVPSGALAGNRVSVEWLQPVEDNVNGYQLERDGALSATWSMAF